MSTTTLDRPTILRAALQLVDQHGLEALSMRKLGAQLGVEAMTLYYYIPSKAALVSGLAEVVLDQLQLPRTDNGDWREAVREMSRSFRRLGLEHPNVFPVLANVGLDNPASYPPTEAVLARLRRAGFDEHRAFTAFAALRSFVVGHVLWVLGDQLLGCERLPASDAVPADRFPYLSSYLPRLAECDPEVEFEGGLDIMISGLEALLRAG
jgi:AcrR family transcriptional regulator